MANETTKDLCKTCSHYWTDYPLHIMDKQLFDRPLLSEEYYPHCEIADKSIGYNTMNEVVPYPCLECPFNCYSKKKEL
jgi:hypothetical protein